MIKNYYLSFLLICCAVAFGYGQIATIDFETNLSGYSHTPSQTPATDPGDQYFHRAIPSDVAIYEGSEGPYTNVTGSWLFVGSAPIAFNSGNPGILTLDPINISSYTNLELSIDWGAVPNDWDDTNSITVEYRYDGAGAWSTLYSFGHNNGSNDPLVLSGNATGGNNTANGAVLTYALQTVTTDNFSGSGTNINIRIVVDSEHNYEAFGLDNIVLDGTISCTDAVDFANIQDPTTTQTITIGGNFDVYAQCYEPGLTDTAFNQGAGISAWIGFNTTDATSVADFTDPSWTWVAATYNNVASGNNDEYQANIGTAITVPGTYYFASRFELNGCSGSYAYGGSGGDWNNDSVQLNVLADQVDFCSLQSPATGTQVVGAQYNVYSRAFEPGVTPTAGEQANISAWIGFNTTDAVTLADFTDPSWTWVPSLWLLQAGNDDEYIADIGPSIPAAGTYYYVSRFQLNGSDYSYGGITPPNGGNHWDGITYISGVLTVTDPPIADVVITEIMYNPPAADDYEWVEICNLNGTAEDISNYTIEVNGTTRFTFPASTSIPANSCITVLLGHLVSSPAPECPFTPDYSNPIGNTNFLFNGGATITLESPTSAIADLVFYDNADSNATAGNGSSFHVIDATLNNSDTATNWQAVSDGGSPGVNTLVSPCSVVELQLVDDSNVDQACGFTIDFGLPAIGFNTDVTFDIDNDGSLDLDVSSIVISGIDAGDFTIVSPATPFTVTSGNTQTVTVRFNTAIIGIKNAALTINNNDSDEGMCVINLTGEGVSPSPNIIVRGIIGSNPTIPNGSITASGLNNTLYAAQDINDVPSQTKGFRIGNEGGTDMLNINSITLSGAGAPDFSVTANLSNPATNPLAINADLDFTITFDPVTNSGTRVATVTIANSDSNKDPYTFIVQGTANCPLVSGSISPASGPAGTTVTVLSPGNSFLGFLSAELNGVPLDLVSESMNELVVRLPNTITTGGPLSIELSNGCIFSNTFTLLDETIAGCQTSTSGTVSDLFISEVTDSPSGSLTYVELYNATGAAINFATTNYSIILYNNGNTSSPKTLVLNSGTVANNSTYVISFGVTTGSQCAVPGGDGSSAQVDQPLPGASINFFRRVSGVDNPNLGHDFIGLYDTAAVTSTASDGLIDAWGTLGDETWAIGLGLGTKGANFERDASSMIPNSNTIFNATAWTITNWNEVDCSDVDYSTIGAYDFSTGVPPTVTLQPIDPTFACTFSASLTIAGTEGFNGPIPPDTQDLEYQWYFNAPGSATWTEIMPFNTDYSGQQTAILTINDTSNLDDYQYYCQLREDSATCYQASNAVKLEIAGATWDGTYWNWDDGTPQDTLPTSSTIVILNGHFNTSNPGIEDSFNACSLIINPGFTLTVANSDFVEVENNVTINGSIIVETQGSFVQNGIGAAAGTFTNNGTSSVIKQTSDFFDDGINYHYTYWSSPVVNADIATVFPNPRGNRKFYFDTSQYIDTDGDDISDTPNDWQPASGSMEIGRGYAVTATTPPGFPYNNTNTFTGAFNTGDIPKSIDMNGYIGDDDWNFIGNPYPSAIDFEELYNQHNTLIEGAAYLWSQALPPSDLNDGNEVLNFNMSDYAIITANSGNTAGGAIGLPPNDYIPSGQGFFVKAINTGVLTFRNDMRSTGNNSVFYRSVNNDNADSSNRLWLDLTSDNGVFSQILLAYVTGGTDGFDDWSYDAPRNLSTGSYTSLYTIIDSDERKFAIQGKNPESLDLNESVKVGFITSINIPTIYKISIPILEGIFMDNNAIYLKDNSLNIVHNLKESDYNFTSEAGEYNNRFEIVFRADALSINDSQVDANDLTIIELANGDVEIKVGKKLTITNVAILDVLGRQIYNLSGTSSREIYNLSSLSKAAYIAKVTLSNGQVISKKAIKQR